MAARGDAGARVYRQFGTQGFDPERDMVALTDVARRSLATSMALVTIIDGSDMHVVAGSGLDEERVLAFESLCMAARRAGRAVTITDSQGEEPDEEMELARALGLRAFATVPINRRQADGLAGRVIGALCVGDTVPRTFSDAECATLRDLAALAESVIDARRAAAEALAMADQRTMRGRELRRADRQFRQAERMANMGSWRYVIADQSVHWSEQTNTIYGLPVTHQPTLAEALEFYPPASRAAMTSALAHTIETGEPFDLELDFINAAGRQLRVRAMAELELAGGIPVAVIGVFQDITARHQLEQQLRRSASIDELTGIPNRAAFVRELEGRIERARGENTPLALLLVDLDGYKRINDTYGHPAGDEVLRAVAARLTAIGAEEAFAARLGGDELALIFTSERDCAELVARTGRLLSSIAGPVRYDGRTIEISGTVGIAWLVPEITGMRELVQRADIALYEAKRSQRGTARVFGTDQVIRPARERRNAA